MTLLRIAGGTDHEVRKASELAFNKEIGKRIREKREMVGMSLDYMGKILDIDPTTVSRHESGAVPLTVVRAARICHAIGLDIRELVK